MNQKQVKQFFKDLSYKTVKFEIVCNSGEVTVSGSRSLVDPITGISAVLEASETFTYKDCTEVELLNAMRDWMHAIECHEADEWIIYKGKQPFQPHKAKITTL